MPPRKGKTPASRSVGAQAPVAANPYAVPEPVLEKSRDNVRNQTKSRAPVTKYVMPPAAPMPVFRAHGHVLTERGWVREEGQKHHG